MVSLAVYLPIFYFSFCQKTNLHLYKQASYCLLFPLVFQILKAPILTSIENFLLKSGHSTASSAEGAHVNTPLLLNTLKKSYELL